MKIETIMIIRSPMTFPVNQGQTKLTPARKLHKKFTEQITASLKISKNPSPTRKNMYHNHTSHIFCNNADG